MFPAMATVTPARLSKREVRVVTVVLPLVPVIANTCGWYPCALAKQSMACANRLNSVPCQSPFCWVAVHTDSTCAGDKPGLLKTPFIDESSSKAASKDPWMNVTSVLSDRMVAKHGGCSRVSTTVTLAPCSTHQRTMAKPEVPKPKTNICRSASIFMVNATSM